MSVVSSRRSARRIEVENERRTAIRLQAYAEIRADPGGTSLPIPSEVVDISNTGAKIQEIDGALPDEFTLQSSGRKSLARVVRRDRTTIGVEFVDP